MELVTKHSRRKKVPGSFGLSYAMRFHVMVSGSFLASSAVLIGFAVLWKMLNYVIPGDSAS